MYPWLVEAPLTGVHIATGTPLVYSYVVFGGGLSMALFLLAGGVLVVSCKSVPQECSHKRTSVIPRQFYNSVPQEFPVRVFPQERQCPTSVFTQECPRGVFPQECHTKPVLQECPTRLSQECSHSVIARVAYQDCSGFGHSVRVLHLSKALFSEVWFVNFSGCLRVATVPIRASELDRV